MIERHVTFHVPEKFTGRFVEFFKEAYRPAMARTEGFIKAELLQDEETPGDLKMVLRFRSAEAAAAWRASEEHASLKPGLKALYSGSELKVYGVLVESR